MSETRKNIYLLIATNCLNTIYFIFLNTFLISFLFKHTSENVSEISLYNFMGYLTVGILAYATGNWVKRGNRLLMYELGILGTFIFFVAFIFLQEKITNHVILCGIIFGIITALKAFPVNLIIADNVAASQLISFKGYLESIKNIVKIATPVILGFFLTFDSYFHTVAFLALLSLVEFILFAQIKAPRQKQLPKLKIKEYCLESRKNSFVNYLYGIEFCRGITIEGGLLTLITLYTVYLFKTDFNLGLISSIFGGFIIVFNFIFGRYCKYKYFANILLVTGMLVISSVIIFIFFPNRTNFIFYNFCFTVVSQFMRMICDINIFNVSNMPEIKQYKNEYFIVREIFLNIGRLVSFGMLFILGALANFGMLKYFLLLLTIFIALMCYYGIRLNHRFIKTGRLK